MAPCRVSGKVSLSWESFPLGDAFPYAPPFEKLASLTEMIAWAIKIILNVTKIMAFTTGTIDSLAELIA